MKKKQTVSYASMATKISKLGQSCKQENDALNLLKQSFANHKRISEARLQAINVKMQTDPDSAIKSEFNNIKSKANSEIISPIKKSIDNITKYHTIHAELIVKVSMVDDDNRELIKQLSNIKANLNTLDNNFKKWKDESESLEIQIEQMSIKISSFEALKKLDKIEKHIDKLAKSISDLVIDINEYNTHDIVEVIAKLKSLCTLTTTLERTNINKTTTPKPS